jgi:hypothetical protein
MTLPELKALLAYNEQPQNGNKEEILDKIADAKLLGCIPKCPECVEGRLKFSRFDGTYKCQGFFNQDSGEYQRCGRKFKREDVKRDEFV